ncbi:MAG: pseudouridine synthase [Bacteroidota bacterium]
MRLNRYIAKAGVCSRRKADALIAEGLVKVNGAVVSELGAQYTPGDIVEVNGQLVSPRPFQYILMNKPGDTITTVQDERDRTTVLDLLTLADEDKQGLFPVGRLDRHTTGVLLVTNDGELAHRLMHPRYEVPKLYQVRTAKNVKPHELAQLVEGIELDGEQAKADRATYLDPDKHRELGLLLHEGRNRQIRRMLEALGHDVERLERVGYAGLTVEGVRRGRWRRLSSAEVKRLRRLVGLK